MAPQARSYIFEPLMNVVKYKSYSFWISFMLFVFVTSNVFCQFDNGRDVKFSSSNEISGFDAFRVPQWENQYHTESFGDTNIYHIANKSTIINQRDSVDLIIINNTLDLTNLQFKIGDSTISLNSKWLAQDTFRIYLPPATEDYYLEVYHLNELKAKLCVVVYDLTPVNVAIVPLVHFNIREEQLQQYLNQLFRPAGINIQLEIKNRYYNTIIPDSAFANPSPEHDRYTNDMIDVRDAYFSDHPHDSKTYYIFIVSRFVDAEVQGYMVRNKAVGFVKYDKEVLFRTIAHELGFGIGGLSDSWNDNGPDKGTTSNLMDLEGVHLTKTQWELLRQRSDVISYYDDYEDVQTNNGLIAYYLWEEDKNGKIILKGSDFSSSVLRPYKKNTYSLHLDIDNFFFAHLFVIWEYPICLLHILCFILMFFTSAYVRRRLTRRMLWFQRSRFLRFIFRVIVFVSFILAYWFTFWLINEGYYLFEVKKGELEYLEGMSLNQVKSEIGKNENTRRLQEKNLGSEVLIKRGNKWIVKRRKQVLYFSLRKDASGQIFCSYTHDSDSLIVKSLDYSKKAKSHYYVVSTISQDGNLESQEVFNHLGIKMTDKIGLKDPAKRILLFVNGYRPTSLGATFEENFEDILNKGLEFKNTNNRIYSFDRHGYWRPWNEIDLMFVRRLNPDEFYYADGHHAVATSNHRSLINFTQIATQYPKRCKDSNNHVCLTSKKGWKYLGLSREVNTVELHNLNPNKSGFRTRRSNGKIAGRNLYQMFNEIPNVSQNDTLYIVAHSMGYAYSLGIIEKLRGKINFGGFYIIAPENGSAGELVESEWQEVWQYGSDFEAHKLSAPCLIDGIAPQTKVGGLSPRNRAYIPESMYKQMGFYDSHFIGYYSWIFDIGSDQPGFIRQR